MSFSHFTDLVDIGVAIGVAAGVAKGVVQELSAPSNPVSFPFVGAMDSHLHFIEAISFVIYLFL
jgi:hypothetical protein